MEFPVDIWLRGDNHATTELIAPVAREPQAWTDGDVADVLIGMLRAIDRARHPDASSAERPIGLRGFSWIVNPFESGGVVIAIEMTLGAVIAGPFDVAESVLTRMIQSAIDKWKSGEVENWISGQRSAAFAADRGRPGEG
jgi:hypothetical protein